MELSDQQNMEDEWQAWQVVVARWNQVIGESMNDPKYDPLYAAIRAWGEVLVDLRVHQSADIRENARNDALNARD